MVVCRKTKDGRRRIIARKGEEVMGGSVEGGLALADGDGDGDGDGDSDGDGGGWSAARVVGTG